jgi:hypothetical protein
MIESIKHFTIVNLAMEPQASVFTKIIYFLPSLELLRKSRVLLLRDLVIVKATFSWLEVKTGHTQVG